MTTAEVLEPNVQNSTNFAEAYARAVAAEDTLPRPAFLGGEGRQLGEASYKLAQACIMLAADAHPKQLKRFMGNVYQALPDIPELDTANSTISPGNFAVHAGFRLLRERNMQHSHERLRDITHRWATKRMLLTGRDLLYNRNPGAVGARTEMLGTSLLTRPGKSSLAFPALPHLEHGYRNQKRNYDTLLINTSSTGEFITKKVQFKTHHTGGDHDSSAYFYVPCWEDHDPDIVVISGCCEITDGDPARYDELAHLLRRELTGAASADDLSELDKASERLTTAIITNDTAHSRYQGIYRQVNRETTITDESDLILPPAQNEQ